MVTLALFMMAGIMGLAVDLGWSYFTKKSAQTAADAAALAAAEAAFAAESDEDTNSTYECGTEVACVALSQCPSRPESADKQHRNRLPLRETEQVSGAAGARQTSPRIPPRDPPTVPGVTVYYWATARVAKFAAFLCAGNALSVAAPGQPGRSSTQPSPARWFAES
jgi:hypothetical protein